MKKLISVLLTLAMMCSVLTVIASAQSFTYDDSFLLGDADGSGAVNARDSLSTKAYIAGVEIEGLGFNSDAADITADGIINAKDVFYLKAAMAGVADLADFENGYNVASFLIGGVSVSEFCIIVPEGTTKDDNIDYASTELRDYVETATGVRLDICQGESNATKSHAIIFNKVPYDTELGQELGYEGYKMTFSDGNLNIYGTLRGNMYCVYDILEKYLKFNFYSNSTTFLKKSRCVSIPADIDETFVPALRFRFAGQSFGKESFYTHYLPLKLNGTQMYSHEEDYRYGLLTGPLFINAHSYGYYWQMATGYQ
ncbi:MAG: dockerin type I repeat-containing protein, partial [Clostridia bacterium]|nr:dockerin type I repeat-containing protein [Clostridia bacterium]